LFAAWVGGIIAIQVIGHYEGLLTQVAAVAAFIPIVIGMGGNVGTQSATIVVRGLATGKITAGQAWRVAVREVRVGVLLGIVFGVLLAIVTPFLIATEAPLGLIVGASIITTMTLAATVGTSMPILLRRLGVDPAIATGPMVTTSMDVLGVLAYFLIASSLLAVLT
jgi:magnesium transporter